MLNEMALFIVHGLCPRELVRNLTPAPPLILAKAAVGALRAAAVGLPLAFAPVAGAGVSTTHSAPSQLHRIDFLLDRSTSARGSGRVGASSEHFSGEGTGLVRIESRSAAGPCVPLLVHLQATERCVQMLACVSPPGRRSSPALCSSHTRTLFPTVALASSASAAPVVQQLPQISSLSPFVLNPQ